MYPAVIDAAPLAAGHVASLAAIDRSGAAVAVRHGFDAAALTEIATPDADGIRHIRTAQLGRVVIDLTPGTDDGATYRGYTIDGDALRALPIGSSFDARTGEFAWAPPLAFGGTHHLVFVGGAPERDQQLRVDVTIDAHPAAAGEARLMIDTPRDGADVGQPFTIAGWAFDPNGPAFGSGVDTLHVWAYPVGGGNPLWVGVAAVGGGRPDVAAHFGARFAASGYTLEAAGLPPAVTTSSSTRTASRPIALARRSAALKLRAEAALRSQGLCASPSGRSAVHCASRDADQRRIGGSASGIIWTMM